MILGDGGGIRVDSRNVTRLLWLSPSCPGPGRRPRLRNGERRCGSAVAPRRGTPDRQSGALDRACLRSAFFDEGATRLVRTAPGSDGSSVRLTRLER